jgi:small subunit ribosomal protein S19e
MHKERPPVQGDWWYTRTAALFRTIKILGPIGTQKLRVKYGGKKNRGYRPEHFYKGSGSIIRKVLQQLEKAGFVKKEKESVHKGRFVSPEGDKFLNQVAIAMMKEKNIVIPKRPDEELKISIPVKKKKKKKTKKRKKTVKKRVKKAAVKKEEKPKREKKKEAKPVEKKEEIKEEKPKKEEKLAEKKEEPKPAEEKKEEKPEVKQEVKAEEPKQEKSE